MRLIECVPNFSEGRDHEKIQAIVAEVNRVEGVKVLDLSPDADHHRTDLTMIGEPEKVYEAAMNLAVKAVELIDMTCHKGEHPRMGAVDVVPFIPVSGVEMAECVAMAERFGREFSEKTGVPVYLYEDAARKPERKNLADVRRGEYEGMLKEIGTNPDKVPDFGPNKMPLKSGATGVCARFFLVPFNVNLGTTDVEIAKKIAKAVRFMNGGYRYVKAMGFDIKERGLVQISMNLVNYRGTPIFRVFETIKSEALRYGVPIVGAEIVGLVPMEALVDVADYYLRLENFKFDQVLEKKLLEAYEG
ncbi:MAG: glutamate formimidoyltransferase [Thermoplasmata archaeon HGW-Thermoplasmata-1]|nr:MAG: glutamate formimidoyltransferase [Thermoplasmata archaeon HGW-Thermoplasmata-1]